MEHVSTLCAISTVGIAATSFTLGRVDRDSPKPARFRKKTFLLHDHCARATDPPLSPFAVDIPPRSSTFAVEEKKTASATPSFHSGGLDPVGTGHTQPANHQRKSSLASLILRRRGQTLSTPPFRVEEDSAASHARRLSSSWMRRLSFQPASRSSCQSPISPSFNGPTSPLCSRPSSQRRAPNKLVKRLPSHASGAHNSLPHAPPSPSANPLFRRPATSHQRPDHLRHKATNSLNFEPSLVKDSSRPAISVDVSGGNIPWRPYFISTPDGFTDRLVRRLSTATKSREYGVRRIHTLPDTMPALLLANTLTNKVHLPEAIPQTATPGSPVQFRDPFKTKDNASRQPAVPCPVEGTGLQPSFEDEDDPKSTEMTSAGVGAKTSHNAALSRPKRRAISTPLPSITNPEGVKTEGTIIFSPRSVRRRNITDPTIFRRPLPASQSETLLATGTMGYRRQIAPSYSRADINNFRENGQRPLSSNGTAFSTIHGPFRQRPKRHSIAASDPASTIIGSDDTRIFTSGDEDETDFLSDTAFDSIRTHITTSSNTGLQAPRIDTLFDKELTAGIVGEEKLHLRCLTTDSTFDTRPSANYRCRTNAILNPFAVRSCASQEHDVHEGNSNISFPSDLTDDDGDARSLVAALPGETLRQAGQMEYQNMFLNSHGMYGRRDVLAHQELDMSPNLNKADSVLDSCPKINIFDWSEQTRADREVTGCAERPRTVHGKHVPEVRGSRPPGRKAPNALHLRSQSVPVSRDNATANESRQTSGKYGTWGLGSKGVSEDWDSDFEFDDTDESTSGSILPDKNMSAMIVPQAIMERQASLHGQFGQVQELTLLVEELKRLRHQASFLDIVHGPSNELWKEAEGIVNLATLDDEDNGPSPPGSPSSLTFSFDDSEEESSNTNDASKRASGESWQASLPEQFTPPNHAATSQDHKELSTKANSVLDLIYKQRISHDSPYMEPHIPRSKKLPFDTRSLRDLVVRAGVVTRALKEVIRKAEGVASEPDGSMHHSAPPFSQIFNQSSNDNLSTFETRCVA
ncbi:hypothetical protein BDV25DRAFT_165884 [Aspergillus avenaceus]|uniref:Uncharacterized protein n=1 Tax=Aspergillus avenaceus TaxID=36643 RepID=A0A5N6TEZ9_ASPAV|nr:hypothetical protein BDV25DRAFT_165884 [Aspergillus avenaceus]